MLRAEEEQHLGALVDALRLVLDLRVRHAARLALGHQPHLRARERRQREREEDREQQRPAAEEDAAGEVSVARESW